jgi:hypothetical protein
LFEIRIITENDFYNPWARAPQEKELRFPTVENNTVFTHFKIPAINYRSDGLN